MCRNYRRSCNPCLFWNIWIEEFFFAPVIVVAPWGCKEINFSIFPWQNHIVCEDCLIDIRKEMWCSYSKCSFLLSYQFDYRGYIWYTGIITGDILLANDGFLVLMKLGNFLTVCQRCLLDLSRFCVMWYMSVTLYPETYAPKFQKKSTNSIFSD